MIETYVKSTPAFNEPGLTLYKFEKPGNIPDLLKQFRQVDPLCPPLYSVCLNQWVKLFGDSDLAIRLLSTLFSVLTVASIFIICRYFFGYNCALVSSLLCAVSPFDIHYAQEARMYSLEALACTLSTGFLFALIWKAHLKPAIYAALIVGYALSCFCAFNSHYTSLFYLIAQAIVVMLICILNKSWKILGLFILGWGATIALCLPWFDLFIQAANLRHSSFYVSGSQDLVWALKALFISLPTNLIVFLAGKRVYAFCFPIYLTSFALLAMAFWKYFLKVPTNFKLKNSEDLQMSACLWLLALLPPLAVWLLDVREHHKVIEVARYLIATAPAIYMLSGKAFCDWAGSPKFKLWFIGIHVGFCLLNNAYAHIIPQREPWRQMAALVEEKINPQTLLLVSEPYNIFCLDRYLITPRRQIGLIGCSGETGLKQSLQALPKDSQDFWLLTAQSGETMAMQMPAQYRLLEAIHLHHALHLRHYSLGK